MKIIFRFKVKQKTQGMFETQKYRSKRSSGEICLKGKEKHRGMLETQKSGDKTSSGEIGLNIRTHASPKVGQDQASGGVSVLCWLAAPVAMLYKKTSKIW